MAGYGKKPPKAGKGKPTKVTAFQAAQVKEKQREKDKAVPTEADSISHRTCMPPP